MPRIAPLSLVAALAIGAGVFAQQAPAPAAPVAIVGATALVEGLVTVSFDTQVSTVSNDSKVINRSRYVTSSNGKVTLRFVDGCDLFLGPNQWVDVDADRTCDDRIAMIQFLGNNNLAAGFLLGDGTQVLAVALLLGGGGSAVSGGSSGGGSDGSGTVGPVGPGGPTDPTGPTEPANPTPIPG